VNLKEIHDQLMPYLVDEKAHEPRALAQVYHQEEEPRFEAAEDHSQSLWRLFLSSSYPKMARRC